MPEIKNDEDFRQALGALDAGEQRALGAAFIAPLLNLTDDIRIAHGVKMVREGGSDDELAMAFKNVKKAILDSHTRCGAEGNWSEQAGYFIARAAAALLAPEDKGISSPPAWQTAMGCRMARMCEAIDSDEDISGAESARQYAVLEDFLDKTKRGPS